jgi:hypothetical protein
MEVYGMDAEDAAPTLMERKTVRRGLMTGLAGLGAALLMHAKGAGKAEAAPNFVLNDLTNIATGETRLLTSSGTGIAKPVLQVGNGTSTSAVISAITGLNSATVDPAIFGQNVVDGGMGIYGSVNAFTGTGVKGQGGSHFGFGVLGVASSSSVGVEGQATTIGTRGVGLSNSTGVKGVSNVGSSTADGDGSGIGVFGKSNGGPGVRGESTSGPGVFGVSSSQPGVDGVSTGSLGIRGASTNFVGIVGISTNSHGLYGSTHGTSAYGIVAENLAGGPGLLVNGSAQIYGNLQVFGAKNAIIKMQDGTNAAVYCQESPEPYFEDFGEARLVKGIAQVSLEPEFATLVAGGKYLVFSFPQGDTRGLYVSRQDANGFEVREVQGGTGNVPFSYRVVTKRKDIEGKRFARVNEDAKRNYEAAREKIAKLPPASVAPQSVNSNGH